ncbi:hypothetical protein Tco_0467208, partial [Tanacetum coccineum]
EDDKRRSEDFIEVIERRLKIRRIFRSLESFVGGCLRDIENNLIRMHLIFSLLLTVSLQDNLEMEMEMEIPSSRDIK